MDPTNAITVIALCAFIGVYVLVMRLLFRLSIGLEDEVTGEDPGCGSYDHGDAMINGRPVRHFCRLRPMRGNQGFIVEIAVGVFGKTRFCVPLSCVESNGRMRSIYGVEIIPLGTLKSAVDWYLRTWQSECHAECADHAERGSST